MNILVFGSLNVDHDYRVTDISRPKETITAKGYEVAAGGKGLNQAIALAKTNEHIYLAGIVGNGGEFLLETLKEYNVDTTLLKQVDTPTGHAIIQIDDNGENSIIVYPGANNEITNEYVDEVLSHFTSGDYLVLQNEINNLAYIINKAHNKGMIILMNPSPCDESLKALPLNLIDYFFINEVEGNMLSGKQEANEIIAEMNKIYPNSKIILTLGGDGAKYFDGNEIYSEPARKVEAIDTVGAGDTFMGYFTYCLSKGFSPQDCLITSTNASAITVTRKGAAKAIPTIDEVLK